MDEHARDIVRELQQFFPALAWRLPLDRQGRILTYVYPNGTSDFGMHESLGVGEVDIQQPFDAIVAWVRAHGGNRGYRASMSTPRDR